MPFFAYTESDRLTVALFNDFLIDQLRFNFLKKLFNGRMGARKRNLWNRFFPNISVYNIRLFNVSDIISE